MNVFWASCEDSHLATAREYSVLVNNKHHSYCFMCCPPYSYLILVILVSKHQVTPCEVLIKVE